MVEVALEDDVGFGPLAVVPDDDVDALGNSAFFTMPDVVVVSTGMQLGDFSSNNFGSGFDCNAVKSRCSGSIVCLPTLAEARNVEAAILL